MTCSSSAGATTIFMATTGSGDPDTADHGPTSSIEACLPGSKSTRVSAFGDTGSTSTGSTEFKDRTSAVNTFTQSPAMAIETTMIAAMAMAVATAEVITAK